jgi:hypothetical protein
VDFKKKEPSPYLFDLTDQEWNEIRNLAIQLIDEGVYVKDQFMHMKASVSAFLMWSDANDVVVESVDPGKITMH